MSSIQERLQMKRSPIDTWNIREQLCLASAVVRSGDQNWMSVSRALKTVGEPNRPGDWYSQKSCAAQYGVLLENVETPKRKKRNSEGVVETPQESILKKLTQERIVEIQKTLAEMSQQYEQIKAEVIETRNPSTSEDRLRELWSGIEANKRAREREAARRAAWLREREDRRARAERAWRPPLAPTAAGQLSAASPAPSPAPPSSPLLTSLLKSSPVVTTPQHISHPANVVETVSPSAGAPTLSMLLEKPGGHEPNADAAIEHIKSQLVQIEQQLKAGAPTALAAHAHAHAHAPALDIDDIEIKAEDVYAFRDIDIVIPPVAAMHKPSPRSLEKPVFKRETDTPPVSLCEPPSETMATKEITVESPKPTPAQELPPSPEETNLHQAKVETEAPPLPAVEPTPEPEVKVSYPEVRFPTTEIRVIQSDEQKIKSADRQAVHPTIKEEVKESEAPPPVPITVPEPPVVPKPETIPEPEPEPVMVTEPKAEVVPEETIVSKESEPEAPTEVKPAAEDAPQQQSDPVVEEAAEPCGEEPQLAPQDIPLPPEPPRAADADVAPTDTGLSPDPPLPSEPEVIPPPEDAADTVEVGIKAEEIPLPPLEAEAGAEAEAGTKAEAGTDGDETQKVADGVSKEEDAEDSMPLKDIIAKETTSAEAVEADVKAEPDEKTEAEAEAEAKPPLEEGHNETDDDTPMEVRYLSREEEKDGKTKRDYSRKKKPDSRTCSGSESAEASAPESPGGCDAERQHRLWKRSVLLVYSRLCAHKYASLFQRPISDEEAPGYSAVVRRPMDLGTIKRNIDSGAVRTTAEFQRDVMLMLSNALLYNSSEHSVYQMARELHEEAQGQLGMLLAAQAHAGLQAPPPGLPAANTRKRRRHAEPRHHHKRPRH